MIQYNTLVVLLGTGLLGASAGLVGGFAVLRRRALTGDALAHAALPGICLAFLLVGERSLPALLTGALVTGLVGIGVVSVLRHTSRVKEDAAIGIVLSVFFGAGIVLSRLIQNRVTTGSKAGLDSYILGKTAGMIAQDVLIIGGVSLIGLVVVVLLFKEFKSVSFDPDFARVQGWPVLPLDLALMGLVAVNVVIGLPAVGVVLMSALLILPAAAARFWTDRLAGMLLLSGVFGLAIGAVGTALSARFRLLPAGPILVLVGSTIFLVSLLFAPRRGVVARWRARHEFAKRHAAHGLLRTLYELVEPTLPRAPPFSLAQIQSRKYGSPRATRRLLAATEREGWTRRVDPETFELTEMGLLEAARAAREDRLRQLLLAEHPDLAPAFLSLEAVSVASVLPPELLGGLEGKLADLGRLPPVPLESTPVGAMP